MTWFFFKHDPPSILMDYAINTRLWADATLKKFVQGKREQATVSALVLGVTDGLDDELLNAYAATGAMHVLAVSGLHISIIYMIVAWLLGPLNKTKKGKWTVALISLLLLWSYAFITGLSPSVLRAVTMFTFVAIARPASMNTNIYNTLAASAFCLLLFDPYLIMSVGFQLSYLAVIGIVYLQPRILRLWEPRRWLVEEAWKITAVSIAAQIATFALGLLYFHQFPNYFLIANLLVIPLSFIVLIMGLLVLAVSMLTVVSQVIGFVLTMAVKFLNAAVFTVDLLPFGLVEDIYITTSQCWILMSAILAFVLMIEFKRFRYLIASCMMLLLFVVAQWTHHYNQVAAKKIAIYRIPGHTAIDLIDHGTAYFFSDTMLINNDESIRFHIKPNRLASGIGRIESSSTLPFMREVNGGKLIDWCGKTIVHINNRNFDIPEKFSCDILVIGNDAVNNLQDIYSHVSCRYVILDSSNSFRYASYLLHQGSVFPFTIHSVLHHGAFNYTIESPES